jgi:hypothetical protein
MTSAVAAALPAPAAIDPFARNLDGEWHGDTVTVVRVAATLLGGDRFRVCRRGGRLVVEHALTPVQLCDELATTIVAELGLEVDQAEFEAVFTGIVCSTVRGPMAAWRRFYANSVARLESGAACFSPIHSRAAALIEGRQVIDLGSCFGFFPLRLAGRGIDVLATDLSAPTMELLTRMTRLLGRPARTLACDASSVPLPDCCTDTVTALHLIEHLPAQSCDAVVREAIRLARRRVVIAVPFEAEPTACYGHVQRFDRAGLEGIAGRLRRDYPGLRTTVLEHHGGWLVLDL